MSQFQDKIAKMNKMYDLPIAPYPSTRFLGVSVVQRLHDLRGILAEELREIEDIICKANASENNLPYAPPIKGLLAKKPYVPSEIEVLTDVADLMGDIQVYCASEMCKFGLPNDSVLDIIMESNFSKLDANGLPIHDERGKFMKGPNYWKPEPMIKQLLDAKLLGNGIPEDFPPVQVEEVKKAFGAFDALPFTS